MNVRRLLRPVTRLGALAAIVLLGGCAVGNRYDYSGSLTSLPVSGTGNLALSVVDARPYILSGEKKPDFIGLQRGGFGNPFDVRTASGRPMADEMRDAIAKALHNQGYTVVGATDPAPRKLELRIAEWKTDAMMHFVLHWDMTLSVYDDHGALLAKSSGSGTEEQGAGFQSHNAQSAASYFEMKFTQLARDESVRRALSAAPK
ncbi:MAG: hypothetical protein JSR54_06990 [Proteobacteria bacterium]|nr:hypothetical protein [Pseudomonadota bacterium]